MSSGGRLLLGAATFFLLACSRSQQEAASNAKLNAIEKRITTAEKELADLRTDSLDHQVRLDELEAGAVSVNTQEETYSVARSAIGTFLIVCKKVQPQLDGYSLRVWIGNTTNLIFHGATIHLKWHPPPTERNWFTQINEKDVEIKDVLLPGFYREVQLVVAPSTAAELRNLTIAIKPNRVSLPLARR
jgi:hypothetical protein